MANLNQKSTQCNLYVNNNIYKKRSICTQTAEKTKNVYTQTAKERTSKYDVKNLSYRPKLYDVCVQTNQINIENRLKVNAQVQTENDTVDEIKRIKTEEDELFQLFPRELGNFIITLTRLYESLCCVEKFSSDKQSYLEITRKGLFEEIYNSDSFKYILTNTGVLKMCAVFRGVVKEERVIIDGEIQFNLITQLLQDFASDNFAFCQGLGYEANNILSELTSKPKEMVIYDYPIKYYVSTKCETFFKKPVNVNAEKSNICKNCKALMRYLRVCLKRRTLAASSLVRKKKFDPSSTVNTKYLSPFCIAKKNRLTQYRYHNMKRKIGKLKEKVELLKMNMSTTQLKEMKCVASVKLESLKMNLSRNQHKEMKCVTSIIRDRFSDKIGTVLNAGKLDQDETVIKKQKVLREAWDEDCAMYLGNEFGDFTKDQANISTGSQNNGWNVVTYRIALAIACHSHAAYDALKSFKVLQLPSWPSIQRKSQKPLVELALNYDKL